MDSCMEESPAGTSFSGTPQGDTRLQSIRNHALGSTQEHLSNVHIVSEEGPKKKKGRKGHSKSRNGCFNCKRARIKCNENKPDCDYCAHRGLKCEWSGSLVNQQMIIDGSSSTKVKQVARRPSLDHKVGSACSTFVSNVIPVPINQQGPIFSMQDFRLFNFFIQQAYPHHPIGNDKVWRHEIPCIASDYEFLLHSMLALSASELACSTDPTPQMHSTALTHRVKAISSLNTAISRGITCFQEGNAMLATCFSLLFQSCLLEDGLTEYMMFIRGTISIGISMGARQMQFLFDRLFDQEQLNQVDPMIQSAGLLKSDVVSAACRSFERFAPLCVRKVELDVYKVLSGIARALVTSSRDAYLNLRKMYGLFSYTMSQPEFEQYCDFSSLACQLLQAHFVALQLIMAPVTSAEMKYKEAETGKQDHDFGKTVTWLDGIHRRVPDELKTYFSWTMWVEEMVLNGHLYNDRLKVGDLGEAGELVAN